jgi:hypothetical protein
MHAQRLIRHKFLNPANNDIETIRRAWKILLHGQDKPEQRMQECNDALHFFGTSSVQELLGWYYPDDYPNQKQQFRRRTALFRISRIETRLPTAGSVQIR